MPRKNPTPWGFFREPPVLSYFKNVYFFKRDDRQTDRRTDGQTDRQTTGGSRKKPQGVGFFRAISK